MKYCKRCGFVYYNTRAKVCRPPCYGDLAAFKHDTERDILKKDEYYYTMPVITNNISEDKEPYPLVRKLALSFAREIDSLSNDELIKLRIECSKLSSTNCWWLMYHLGTSSDKTAETLLASRRNQHDIDEVES